MCIAIKDMHLRGAGLIGCAAAYGVYLATREAAAVELALEEDEFLERVRAAGRRLRETRPTAVNLRVGASLRLFLFLLLLLLLFFFVVVVIIVVVVLGATLFWEVPVGTTV
ncbi:unnamed protein product [Polarella glacialis]|uniref:Uncharacterized protein n=1 Tax=Polarella glacialis TaxID=89957 RepID=A0A813J5H0_POLGL|nr:unnamed protein product [Polarella glacialis]